MDAVANRGTDKAAIILFATCLGVLVAQVDTSVVNLAIKHIGYDFKIGIDKLQWIIDSYNLVYASFLLTGGALGDLFGRRKIFAIGIAMFAVGSLICGFAPDPLVLIGGRAITGFGAALLLPTSLSILAVAYSNEKERGRAIGIWASCNGLAFAIGPTLGGWIVDGWGWRMVFFLIIPIAVLALVFTIRGVPDSSNPEGRRLDLTGQFLAILFLGSLTLGAIEGGHWGWFTTSTLVCGATSLISLVMLIIVEGRTQGALIPLNLFFKRGLSASISVALLMTFGMYALLFLVPLYLQTMRSVSVFVAGIELLPMSLTFLLVSRRSGPIVAKFGSCLVMTTGMIFMGIGLLIMGQVSQTTSLWMIECALLIVGLGLGLNTGPVAAVAVSCVSRERAGTASSLVNTARMVGATLGIAALGAIFAGYGGQSASSEHMVEGLHAAFNVGAGGEFLGALIAFFFIL